MAAGEHSILYKPVNAVWRGAVDLAGAEENLPHEVPDHVVMALFVFVVVTVLGVTVSRGLRKDDPGKFQQMIELLLLWLRSLLEDTIGEGGSRHLPLIASFAIFIFVSNLSGSIFFLQPPTQNVNVTFALSITAWVLYHLFGLRRNGLRYFKHFAGPIILLAPLFIPLEIITHAARVLSLGLRLFGNIFGEHLAAAAIFGLIPFAVPLPIMALGLMGATIQTFIFILLTTVYIAEAEAEAH
jgi:F-type H+-transporting ATPase subunit a